MHASIIRTATTAALVGTLAFTLASCKKTVPVPDDNNAMMEGSDSEEFVGNVGDLLKKNQDVTCTFARSDDAGTMQGTVFVARTGQMAGSFNLDSPQFGTMKMHVIRDGEYGYTWGFPSETQGTKVKLDDEGKPMKKEKENGPSIDDPMEYRCSTWKKDDAKFVPPSNVEFQDISAMMEAVTGAKCDVCDNVPDATGKANCRKAMGC